MGNSIKLTKRACALVRMSAKQTNKNKIVRVLDQELDKITDKILFTQYYNSTAILEQEK